MKLNRKNTFDYLALLFLGLVAVGTSAYLASMVVGYRALIWLSVICLLAGAASGAGGIIAVRIKERRPSRAPLDEV